jgi:pilus assembly protein Flp/PilA
MVGFPAKIAKSLTAFARNESGSTAIEYGLIASGIFLAIVLVVGDLSSTVKVMYTGISDKVAAQTTP